MLYNIMLVVQILVALGIIGLVLIQHGKGADAGAAFGGGASGTVFGSKGSGNFLTKLTSVLAAVFFANSLMLAWIVSHPDNIGGDASIVPTAITETIDKKADAPVDVPGGAGDVAPASTTSEGASSPSDIPK